jgi:hypothetical protein
LILLYDLIALKVQIYMATAKEKKATRSNEFGMILVRKWMKIRNVEKWQRQ